MHLGEERERRRKRGQDAKNTTIIVTLSKPSGPASCCVMETVIKSTTCWRGRGRGGRKEGGRKEEGREEEGRKEGRRKEEEVGK
jgi:hypothetical protein